MKPVVVSSLEQRCRLKQGDITRGGHYSIRVHWAGRKNLFGGERRREMEVKSFPVACGKFINVGDVEWNELEKPGFALVPRRISYVERMFAARLRGTSMEPEIRDRDYGIFDPSMVGTRQGRLVLVEQEGQFGLSYYSLKKYFSKKCYASDGAWEHEFITLLPLNNEHRPILLQNDERYCVRGRLVGTVSHIERIEPPDYLYAPDGWDYPQP